MKISVIIPVFNVEKYLERAINSILNQSFKDYEIWLVDDGSTDGSGAICDKYEAQNVNVHVIHKENGGPSHSRNVGINKASGEYVTYIDSDDYVTADYLKCLYTMVEKYNADIACGGFGFFSNDDVVSEDETGKYVVRRYAGIDACRALLYEKDFHTSTCNLLVKRSIAADNLFPEGKYHEDEMTTFRYFLSAEKVVITDKVLYFYYQREGSIMHTFGQPVKDELYAANYYVEVCKRISNDLEKAAKHKKFSLIIETLINYREIKTAYSNLYEENLKYLKENSLKILFGAHSSLRNRKRALLILLIPSRL